MAYKFVNFWDVAISQAITDSATTVYVSSDDAALLPSIGTGNEIRAVLYTDDETREIVSITANSSGALTITRARESTTAQAWPAGTRLVATMTAAQLQDVLSSTAVRFIGTSVSNSTNDYTVTVSGNIPSLTAGEQVSFTIPTTNVAGSAVRVKISNGVTETAFTNVLLPSNLAPDAGDFEAGFRVTLIYLGSSWYLTGPSSYQGVFRQINEGPLGNPNFERNSRFESWANGTSFSSPVTLTSICDGWYVQHDGTIGTYTVSRQTFTLGQTDVPFDPRYWLRWDHSSAGSGSTLRSLRSKIPGVWTRSSERIIRRVYAKADTARTVTAKIIQHFGTGGAPSSDVEAGTESWSLTTSWQAFDLEVTLPSITGKTLGTNSDDGIILALDLPVNTTMTIDLAMPSTEPGEISTYHNGQFPLRPEFGGTGSSIDLGSGVGNGLISNGISFISEPLADYDAIINGDFNFWQRATSFTSIANGTYSADRFNYVKTTSAVHDISRSTDVPAIALARRQANYSLLVDCTTADASIAAGDTNYVQTKIEGWHFLPLSQRDFTLCFWVKGTKIGIHCVAFRNSGADRSYVAEYTINVTDTWEFKTITVPANPVTGTWDFTTGVGLTVDFSLACGSTFQTTANAWQSGNFLATANQVNALDSTSNNFRLWGVRLVPGKAARPHIIRPYGAELELCQRFYEKSYDLATALGTATSVGAISGSNQTGGGLDVNIRFKVQKRAAPTVTPYNPSSGASGNARTFTSGGSATDRTATAGGIGEHGCNISATTTDVVIQTHFTAVCEL